MSIESEGIIALYERHADAWVGARLLEGSLYEKPWLDRFCALLPSAGSVLDCGCGAGEPIARYLSQCGYSVMGIDSSLAMVRMFQTRLPGQARSRQICGRSVFGKHFTASLRGTASFIWTTVISGRCFQHFGVMPQRGPHLCSRPDHRTGRSSGGWKESRSTMRA